MIKYEHTQIGHLMVVVFGAIAALYIFILVQAELEVPIAVIMAIVLFILASFSTLKVTIDDKSLRVKFGYGIFRRTFALSEITSARRVKNHWYYGWGIRFWFWPRMMILNVSGFDAVEIKMQSGKIYRIGTDEPDRLEYAINSAIQTHI